MQSVLWRRAFTLWLFPLSIFLKTMTWVNKEKYTTGFTETPTSIKCCSVPHLGLHVTASPIQRDYTGPKWEYTFNQRLYCVTHFSLLLAIYYQTKGPMKTRGNVYLKQSKGLGPAFKQTTPFYSKSFSILYKNIEIYCPSLQNLLVLHQVICPSSEHHATFNDLSMISPWLSG